MAKSKQEPTFLMSAGAKLMVIRRFSLVGGLIPEFFKAELTLSLASVTALSAKPTILNEWRPTLISASTSINSTFNPSSSAEKILATVLLITFFSFTFLAKNRSRFGFQNFKRNQNSAFFANAVISFLHFLESIFNI